MTPILRERIKHPVAWVGSDFKSKDDLAFDLNHTHVAALKDLLARLKDVPTEQIVLAQCAHPALDDDLARILDEVVDGRGLVLVRGFPVDGHPIEEIEKMYWIFTRHLGPHLSMNGFGLKLVRVQQEILPGGTQSARGTKSAGELAFHCDKGDLFVLLYVRQAESGGESQFASGPAAHNAILESSPDLLPILYRGFPYHRRSEQPTHQPVVTPYNVPIFANDNGKISINYTFSGIYPAFQALGREFTPEESEALDLLGKVLVEQQLEIRAASGEMSIANNYAMCHSRSSFVDGRTPDKQRLVIRCATELAPWRKRLPMHLGREFDYMENEAGRAGSDPVPGREGVAKNDYEAVPEALANMIREKQRKPAPRSTAKAGSLV